MNRILLAALVGTLTLSACDSTDPEEQTQPLNVQTATDVVADLTTGRDPNTGAPISANLFTLYDLDAGAVVVSSNETDPAVRAADSTGTAWDIGFRGTEIIFNGGTSGPGQGAAQLVTGRTFAEVTEAPADGYAADGSNTDCARGANVLCPLDEESWYDYNPETMILSPIPGQTIVLKTATGDYAKVRILSYYEGSPATPDPFADASRYYTFEYVVQPDGSRDFETTDVDA